MLSSDRQLEKDQKLLFKQCRINGPTSSMIFSYVEACSQSSNCFAQDKDSTHYKWKVTITLADKSEIVALKHSISSFGDKSETNRYNYISETLKSYLIVVLVNTSYCIMEIFRDELKEINRIPHRWIRQVIFLNALKQEDRLLRLGNVCKFITLLVLLRCEDLTHNGLVVLADVQFVQRLEFHVSWLNWSNILGSFFFSFVLSCSRNLLNVSVPLIDLQTSFLLFFGQYS